MAKISIFIICLAKVCLFTVAVALDAMTGVLLDFLVKEWPSLDVLWNKFDWCSGNTAVSTVSCFCSSCWSEAFLWKALDVDVGEWLIWRLLLLLPLLMLFRETLFLKVGDVSSSLLLLLLLLLCTGDCPPADAKWVLDAALILNWRWNFWG